MADEEQEDAVSQLRRMQDRLEKRFEVRQQRFERMGAKLERRLGGLSAVEKHILLLRLTELVESAPHITTQLTREERQWLARVGAVFSQLEDTMWRIKFDSTVGMIAQYPQWTTNNIVGYAYDVIEILTLELELDGRSEIGSVYEPGNIYQYFADVKEIIAGAETEIFLVDPFFNGEIFDAYFAAIDPALTLHLLVDRYANDLKGYVERHITTYGSQIDLRRNKNELHDRLIFVDQERCWFAGGSFKDAGKKASYLIPFGTELAAQKYAMYRDIWGKSSGLLGSSD